MDEIQQIKERLDIADIISSYLTLKKAGSHLKGNCPFHNEKSASFMVSPERQSFKCFGCGEGGDIFTFIEKMEGVDFYNALKILADKAGVKLRKDSVQYGDKNFKADQKTHLYEINDWAKKVYHKILIDHPKAEKARRYVEQRGMSPETIEDFEIGYAPDSWDLLVKFLRNKGYSDNEIVQSGVAIKSEKGGIYDRFRGRIIFPINNIMGTTIAFTSRILESGGKNENQAKYINSSESPIYIKGKTLYGLDKAKLHIKEKDLAVFVEGNMDVIACHQAGFKNVVATSGTAFTEEQLKILSRYSQEVAFSFDNDEAGETAMKKAIKMALTNDASAKIIALPAPYKDPDEAIKSDPKNWKKAVSSARSGLEYWIDLLIRKNPELDVLTKKKIAREILPVIKTIYSEIEKEYYIKYLSKKLSISEKALVSVLEKTKASEPPKQPEAQEMPVLKLSVLEQILGIIWYKPELLNTVSNQLNNAVNDKTSEFIKMIQDNKIEEDKIKPIEEQILNQYSMVVGQNIDFSDQDATKSELVFLLARYRSDAKDHLKLEFAKKIQEAEAAGDTAKIKNLLQEFSNLIK